jgi:hypothetical protein
LNQTQTISQHFTQLKADDAVCSANIAEKKKKVIKLQMAINNWKKKNEWNIKESQARNAALKVAKNEMDAHCVELKTKMAKYRAAEGEKLAQMTSMARQAQKLNQFKLKQAERILTMAELASKLETESEKGMIEEWKNNQDGEPAVPEAALEGFYAKYNKVCLDRMALDAEKTRLREENAQLRTLLQQYLTSISLPNETNDGISKAPTSNGLLNITSRAPLVPSFLTHSNLAIRQRPAAVVREASAIVHVREMHVTGRR